MFIAAGRADHSKDPAKPSGYFEYDHKWDAIKDKLGGAKPE